MDEALRKRWEEILLLRSDVLRILEGARQAKVIGHSLDARVKLAAPAEWEEKLRGQEGLLRSVFIVSEVKFVPREELVNIGEGSEIQGLFIEVGPSSEPKCERCWVHSQFVGKIAEHPTLCDRCHDVLAGRD